ncbi:Tigger transposable element-derived protein 6, partial [Trichinella papuae]
LQAFQKSTVTVFLCANMTGTEKRKLLVIGNSKKPRCFKSAKQLPVTHAANQKAWMTATVFRSELSLWNRALEKKNRKILLLVDNCTAHYTNYPLSNISVHFFQPNTTSVVQPMDLGIIRCFKSHYRRNLILFILDSASNDFGAVSLLQAICLLYDAWESVTPECMKNCFKKAELTNDSYCNDENDFPLTMWLTRESISRFDEISELDVYVDIDAAVITSDVPTMDDIVNDIHCVKQEDSDDSDADTTTVETTPLKTYPELIECVDHLERFIEATESADEGIFKAISVVRQFVKDHKPKLRQTTLKDFFQHK